MSTHTDTVRVLSWNVEKGYRAKDAVRWISRLDIEPAAVLWQELQRRDLERIEKALGMTGYIAAPRPGSTNDNAIFVRLDGPFKVVGEYRHSWAPWHAPANIAVRLRDRSGFWSERALSLVSQHACYWSATVRLIEAEWLTTLAKPGWLALAMGDFNSFPAGTDVDWGAVSDQAFHGNRTYQEGDRRVTDDRPDRLLTDAGFIDPARWAAEHLGQADALALTAGYRPGKAKQAGLTRIDRGYMSRELAPAITRFQVGDLTKEPELETISDHLPLLLDFDIDALHNVMNQPEHAA